MDIAEACGPHALDSLRDEWSALVAQCGHATIYQTWEWNQAWWSCFGRTKRLRLLLFHEGDALIGLAPLYVSRHLNTPLRRLAFLGTGASDYPDVIVRDDRVQAVCEALLRYLGSARGFDIADLQHLRPASPLRAVVEQGADRGGPRRQAEIIAQEPCPFVALPASWDEFAGRLGKKSRSNIGYYERLLSRSFAEVRSRIVDGPELAAAMSELFRLHERRWNARLLPGVLGGARVQTFHRRVAERFHERGWLRLHVIEAGGRIISALYCFRFRERYYYYLGGFDPELGKFSPGTVLTAHAIRQAIAEGCCEFDFLRGGEPYKYRWLPEERMNCRLLLVHPGSLRSRTMLYINRVERYVEHHAKAFAEGRGRSRPR